MNVMPTAGRSPGKTPQQLGGFHIIRGRVGSQGGNGIYRDTALPYLRRNLIECDTANDVFLAVREYDKGFLIVALLMCIQNRKGCGYAFVKVRVLAAPCDCVYLRLNIPGVRNEGLGINIITWM